MEDNTIDRFYTSQHYASTFWFLLPSSLFPLARQSSTSIFRFLLVCFLLCFCPFTACLKTPMQMRMMIFWTTPPSKSAVGLHPQNQRQWCRSSVAVPASTFVASVCIDLTCIGSVLFGKTTPRASALYLKCTLSSSIFADITNSWLLAMSAFLIVNKVSMCHIPPCYVNTGTQHLQSERLVYCLENKQKISLVGRELCTLMYTTYVESLPQQLLNISLRVLAICAHGSPKQQSAPPVLIYAYSETRIFTHRRPRATASPFLPLL